MPAGVQHNFATTSRSELLRLDTLYAPPEHPDRLLQASKADAAEYERARHEAHA